MPIECEIPIRPASDERFAETDRLVMKCAYAAQNHFGRLCEESVYENDIAARLRAEGLCDVFTQVPLDVRFGGFRKTYRLDLVVNQTVFELKAVDAIAPDHEAQGFHYAALLGLDRLKLLNFGAPSVQGQLLGTPFARIDRSVSVERDRWKEVSTKCAELAGHAESCLREWGGFLEVGLYNDAMVWHCGGESDCVQRLPVTRGEFAVGRHRVQLHAADCGFIVTALGQNLFDYENELWRLLSALPLRAWQWINIYSAAPEGNEPQP